MTLDERVLTAEELEEGAEIYLGMDQTLRFERKTPVDLSVTSNDLGLVHTWQTDTKMMIFMVSTEYESKKQDLPAVSIALGSPSSEYVSVADSIWEEIKSAQNSEEDSGDVPNIQSSMSGKTITGEESLYFSNSDINGLPQKLYLTEAEAQSY